VVDKEELLASKAKQAELDIALCKSDKKVEELERQLEKAGLRLQESEARCESAQQVSGKHENDLKDLSEAYNTLEEHSFSLESKIQVLEKDLADKEKDLADKDEAGSSSKAVGEVASKYQRQLEVLQADLDHSNQACSELTESREMLVRSCEDLQAQVTELEAKLDEAASALAAAEKSGEKSVSEGMLEEAKAAVRAEARREMEDALRGKEQEHALEMESLKEQLQTSQADYREIRDLYESNSGKAYTEEELKQATDEARTEAAADCDEEIFQLETKLRDMQTKLAAAQAEAEAKALTRASAEAREESSSRQSASREELAAAVAKAKEEAMAEADESMNDLLVCLGQEEKKTEVLRERLEALGENVDDLLEGLEDEEDEEDDEEEG